ncbi:MAG: hypothetical protein ACW99G_01465 [Candidatus Thorarchaeota archaeon]|jgi:hypothetical protein
MGHSDGDKPQPWHCQPFIDGSTYGLEVIYPHKYECAVKRINGEVVFDGDFSEDRCVNSYLKEKPFSSFAPNHYGCTSGLDIKPPDGYCVRIEPHPRFYTDNTNTVPIAVAGHLSGWWSRIFFIAFKSPLEGESHIFREGDPIAQMIFVPKKVSYDIRLMTKEETTKRADREKILSKCGVEASKHIWTDHIGHKFDDKYKVLTSIYAQEGEAGIDKYLKEVNSKHYNNIRASRDPRIKKDNPNKMKLRLVRKTRNENNEIKEEGKER